MKRIFFHPMITPSDVSKANFTRLGIRAMPKTGFLGLALASILGLAALTPSNSAQAETVKIPVGQQQAASHTARPGMGMNMAAVKHQFGEPLKQNPAKGEPPITRWEYEQFSVFFEGDTVIHSVLKFQRSDR